LSRSSGRIDDLSGCEHRFTPEGIAKGLFLDKIDRAPEYAAQLIGHVYEIEQTPSSILEKAHKDVDITVRPEIGPQCGAKEGKLSDFPVPAKRTDFAARNLHIYARVFL
jgi:hypothetical protein